MVEITVEFDYELEQLVSKSIDRLSEKALEAAGEEAVKEIDKNFERGGSDVPWEPNQDGTKPLEGIGKLRTACTENAVIEVEGDAVVISPGGFPQEIADHLNEDRPFMVIPKFREGTYVNNIADKVLQYLKGEV